MNPTDTMWVDTGSKNIWSTGTAAPTTGAHGVNELIWNTATGPGKPAGWVCTVAGEPGTWASFGGVPLTATATYNPPSLTTGTQDAIQTLTVTGAAMGDHVTATFSVDLAGLNVRAWVSAADTVKYVFDNRTAGTVDLASGTVTVKVYK